MKKYKHNKTGQVVRQSEHNFAIYSNLEGGSIQACYLTSDYGWEEVKEKTYEVLSYFQTNHQPNWNGMYHKGSGGLFYNSVMDNGTKEKYLNHSICIIHSIKRLSDGEIFTIKDTFKSTIKGVEKRIRTIDGFWILKDTLYVKNQNASSLLEEIIKCKKLFVSEDGVDLFEGDIVWSYGKSLWKIIDFSLENLKRIHERNKWVTSESNCKEKIIHLFSTEKAANEFIESQSHKFITQDGIKKHMGDKYVYIYNNRILEAFVTQNRYTQIENYYWSTKEAAEKHLYYNTPCLSINDVAKIYKTAKTISKATYGQQAEKLLNLVKEKLK